MNKLFLNYMTAVVIWSINWSYFILSYSFRIALKFKLLQELILKIFTVKIFCKNNKKKNLS